MYLPTYPLEMTLPGQCLPEIQRVVMNLCLNEAYLHVNHTAYKNTDYILFRSTNKFVVVHHT